MTIVRVPSRLWIGGVEHTIVLREGLMRNADVQGRSCGNAASMEVDPELSPSQRAEVLLHELIHRVNYSLGWGQRKGGSPLQEEHVVALGQSLAALFRELEIELDWSDVPSLK